MKNLLISTLSALTLSAAPLGLHAAIVDYSFTVVIDSGSLNGESFVGNFSFDDAQTPAPNPFGSGDLYGLTSFSFSFTGGPFAATDLDYGDAVLESGVFTGLELGAATFAFTPAIDPSFASFFYDLSDGKAGAGRVTYTPRVATVPEPATALLVAGALAGLAGLRRRAS